MVNYKSIFVSLIIATAMFASSCSHYYYAPNEGTLLALNEKNDLKLSAGGNLGGDENESNFSFQAGYSPIKHLGIQSSFFSYKKRGEKDGVTESGNGFISNAAIGAYYFLPTKRISKRRELIVNGPVMQRGVMFDLYAGYAKGEVHNYYEPNTSSHFDFNKSFAQLGIHWQGKIYGISFVSKFGVLDYKNGDVNGKISEEHLADVMDIEKYDTYAFRENSLRFSLGIQHARFFLTTTWLNSSKLDKVKFIDNTVHAGVILELDEFFRKRRPAKKIDP